MSNDQVFVQKDNEHFVRCNRCKTETLLYNPNSLCVFVCPKCQAAHRPDGSQFQSLHKQSKRFSSIIPLYSSCKFFDKDYVVVGCAQKHESDDKKATWEEYTLMDSSGKCIFLSQSYGHWTLIEEGEKPQSFDPKSENEKFIGDDGQEYEFFSSYYQKLTDAAGEFPYEVVNIKGRLSKEFISPPYIFICEENKGEWSFFRGKYLQPAQVGKAFGGALESMPAREGVGSCQPFGMGVNHKKFIMLSSVFLMLAFVGFLLSQAVEDRSYELARVRAAINDSAGTGEGFSNSFAIGGDFPSVIKFDCVGSIDNEWIEGELTLVNDETGQERTFVVGIESYHGFTDGETWSEGSTNETAYLDRVEPGRYHLEVKAFATVIPKDPFLVPSTTAGLSLPSAPVSTRDFFVSAATYSATPWNFWLFALVLLGLMVLIGLVGQSFENVRRGITSSSEDDDE